MALILNIDTATEHASVCLSANGELLAIESNANQKDHAAFIQPAIRKLMEAAGYPLSSLDAIAVSNGPGSYTGLRVGLSTAKGIAYALNKSLILVNTLEIIATAAIKNVTAMSSNQPSTLFCPMIDARRMEVFTAVYDQELAEVLAPCPMILNETSFAKLLSQHNIVFSGSGSGKFKNLIKNNSAIFPDIQHDAHHMSSISEKRYLLKSFADKAYSEPYYLKEFFTPAGKIKSD
jgi:tRNA threonylcarbamoyladenosine biosynthesis protein TsaB